MEPMITPAPVLRGVLVDRRDSSSSTSSGTIDTCGYLSGDYASPLTCGLGYTCSTGPSFLPSHLGCCNAVNCAPSSGAHTCITATSGTIPCTSDSSSACIAQYTSLLFCTDPTAPACITYSQPPPSSGSNADLSPTIFSYSCGPTQTTHIYLATATNAPASASPHTPVTFTHLPIYAYVLIGIGGVLVIILLGLWGKSTSRSHYTQPNPPIGSPYQCRHCRSTNLAFHTVGNGNRNGNAGRRYYVCVNAYCPGPGHTSPNADRHERGWVTWDDDQGVVRGNPLCRCQRISRLDTAGVFSVYNGRRFYTCSTGACDYFVWA